MQLSQSYRERLAQELQTVIEKMQAETDPFSKLYFFSAAYGEAARILNSEWDEELSLIQIVLQTTCNTINTRLQATATGAERGIQLPNKLFEALTAATSDLANIILQGKDNQLVKVLARFAELTYLTTGNGYYLFLKGKIKPQGF